MSNTEKNLDRWQEMLTSLYEFPRQTSTGMRNFIQIQERGWSFFPTKNSTEKERWTDLVQYYGLEFRKQDLLIVPRLSGETQLVSVIRFSWTRPDMFLYFPESDTILRIMNAGMIVKLHLQTLTFGLKDRGDLKLSEIVEIVSPEIEKKLPGVIEISMEELWKEKGK